VARIWIEPYRDQPIPYEYRRDHELRPEATGLLTRKIMFVTVAPFTFRFISTRQIEGCLAYYVQKTRHTDIEPEAASMNHWEAQRWYTELPMYLLEEPKRRKVVKALGRALALSPTLLP